MRSSAAPRMVEPMSDIPNRRIVLARRPRGAADLSCFRLESVSLAPPREGELCCVLSGCLSIRICAGRMSDAPSYAPPVAVGDIMIGQTVSVVEASRHPAWRRGRPGARQQRMAGARGHRRPHARRGSRPDMAHPSYALGVLGMPGFTAFVGLLDIGKPRAHETLVVAAATGAVGSVRRVRSPSSRAVASWASPADRTNADGRCASSASMSASTIGRIRSTSQLAAACPRGIDIYYENVGGKVFRAVVPLLNAHARIPVCGLISQYNESTEAPSGHALWRTAPLCAATDARHPAETHRAARLHHFRRSRAPARRFSGQL